MDRLPLSLKLFDAIKIQVKPEVMPYVFVMALTFYLTKISLIDFITLIIPVLILVEAVVLLTICKGASSVLTTDGILFRNWRGRHTLCYWKNPIEISQLDSNSYLIKDLEKNVRIRIHKVIFSYPEVAKFINENAPLSHKIRGLVANDS